MGAAESYDIHSTPPDESDIQRVQVVAESLEIRTSLLQMCVREGYQATPVTTIETILKKPSASVDLLLLLLESHGRTLDLLAEIRATDALRSVAIMVVVEGPPDPATAAAALFAGADDYCSLETPWALEMRARLRVHMRNKRMRDALTRLRGERNVLRNRVGVDSLTGALGRRALADCIQSCLNSGSAFAILFADIDHFKKVNDTFGHQVGDRALRRVAETLSSGRRSGDVCGRYGGEEFILVVTDVDTDRAPKVAERHRQAVALLRLADVGGPERITISIGVAVFDPEEPDSTVEAILERADRALYAAKAAGRDCIVLADALSTAAINQPSPRTG